MPALAPSASKFPVPRVTGRLARARLVKELTVRSANDAPLLRKLAWPLRRFKPILVVSRVALVTRHADVQEVLSRDEDFTVAEGNAAPMDRVNGPFILGMDRSPQYLRERSLLEACVHDGDSERIRSFVATTASSLVEQSRPRGRIDVVQELARPAAVRLVRDYGQRCPLGAHVRRSNPRDFLGSDPDKALELANLHHIMRRGRVYGPGLGDVLGPDDGQDRGLLFMCINANIERQFEFVQHTWCNNPKFAGLYDEQDPLLATPPAGGGHLTVQDVPVRQRIHGMPSFVTVRGGGYFFLPGIRALRTLAALDR